MPIIPRPQHTAEWLPYYNHDGTDTGADYVSLGKVRRAVSECIKLVPLITPQAADYVDRPEALAKAIERHEAVREVLEATKGYIEARMRWAFANI